jgi:hypothetical protein
MIPYLIRQASFIRAGRIIVLVEGINANPRNSPEISEELGDIGGDCFHEFYKSIYVYHLMRARGFWDWDFDLGAVSTGPTFGAQDHSGSRGEGFRRRALAGALLSA